jgi:hypothetical protein
MPFDKGHEKLGGRKPNTPNKVTQSIRALLNAELPEDALGKLWLKYLYNKDLAIAFEAFKLANQYMFGRPAASPINEEDAPQHAVRSERNRDAACPVCPSQ